MRCRDVWRKLAVAAVLVSLGCSEGPQRQVDVAAGVLPNILIVELDACRPDRIGAYGYERNTSPAIDTFADDPDSVLYRQHYVQGAFTKASTASLFTGLYVFQHGVLYGDDMTPNPEWPNVFAVSELNERFNTMAEILRPLGYWSWGVVKSHHLVAKLGFAQGFDEYFSPETISGDKDRRRKVADLVEGGERPFFGYVHFSACHNPYDNKRHTEFIEEYGRDIEYDEEARRKAGIDFHVAEVKHWILDGSIKLDEEDVRFLDLIYDSRMRWVDEKLVARLIRDLREANAYDDTLLILTADHGEELYDHGGFAHGYATWDEIIHVPLIVKFPQGGRPSSLPIEVKRTTQSVDLLPSILTYLGQERPQDLPGGDLFHAEPRDFAYSENKWGWSLIDGDYKLTKDKKGLMLFNLREDPTERNDLAANEPERVAAMEAQNEALRREVAIPPGAESKVEVELDEEAIENLRGLGYIHD